VREGMMATMLPGGTGGSMARGAPYTIAGKTGTAQVVSRKGVAAVDPRSLPMHLRHRSLFTGFAPVDEPVIALAVAVEGGGYGGSTAGPIARKLFDAYLLGKMPRGVDAVPDDTVVSVGLAAVPRPAAPAAPAPMPPSPSPEPAVMPAAISVGRPLEPVRP
jgi:penicillin-binding protein 2